MKEENQIEELWREDTGEFDLELEKPTRYVPWCSVDPYPSLRTMDDEMAKFPLYFNGPRPFECTVKAGEVLYLISMEVIFYAGYHMQFDIKYAYFNFLQSIRYRSTPSTMINDKLSEEIDSDSAYYES
ncbi:hypothetical protein GYH30_001688 [Glycine max]|uniref:Uncharacterized protein n=2 Tax=Glycine subgen. Soja TaxID=1462606 RepID=K7K422_SOYBN|nr:hypothetical protein GYH30_001688 [Glycine max]RZC30124.1 hypothetical protein D0Y65_001645 [Glycine soja]